MKLMEEQLTPASPSPAQKPKWWTWIGVCVVMLALGIGIGLFLGKQIYSKPTIQPTPSPVAQATPTPDPTANWKTYTFQPLLLSLKVPSELIVHTEEPNPGNDFTAYIQNYPFNSTVPLENAYQLYLVWQKTPIITQAEFQQLQNDLEINSVKSTVVAGYPAIEGQVRGERNRFVVYILIRNTKISLFTSESTQTNKNLTDQILSTFKFVD